MRHSNRVNYSTAKSNLAWWNDLNIPARMTSILSNYVSNCHIEDLEMLACLSKPFSTSWTDFPKTVFSSVKLQRTPSRKRAHQSATASRWNRFVIIPIEDEFTPRRPQKS